MTEVEQAMNVLKEAFESDPSYAHSWHCNIAMSCYDAIHDDVPIGPNFTKHDEAHRVGNDAASRFMKLAFGVVTSKAPPSGD